MIDNYENRALFLLMYYGAPSMDFSKMFPEWYKELMKLKVNSVEESLWFKDFAQEALRMKGELNV